VSGEELQEVGCCWAEGLISWLARWLADWRVGAPFRGHGLIVHELLLEVVKKAVLVEDLPKEVPIREVPLKRGDLPCCCSDLASEQTSRPMNTEAEGPFRQSIDKSERL
jgi:hypothetical protein